MITRVLDYVSYYYMEDIRVEDLANICHISEDTFSKSFYFLYEDKSIGIY